MYNVLNQHLKLTNTTIEQVLSSPSNRTKLTVSEILPNHTIQFDDSLYNADEKILKNSIEYLSDEYEVVLICGHNTAITSFVNSICDAKIDNVPTCAFCEIEFECDSWHDISVKNSRLLAFEYPKKYN
jgi:phosphohistidine phosphatase